MSYKLDLDQFGYRVGSAKSNAAALYVVGATRKEIKDKLGTDQYNVLLELEQQGYIITKKRVRIGKNRPHLRYTISTKVGENNEKKEKNT